MTMGRATSSRATAVRDQIDDERLTALGLLAETFIGLAALLEADLDQHGLGGIDFEVLLRLGRSPDQRLRLGDLTAQTALTSSGVTRLVDRLERAGLVRRQPCSDDRRTTWAVLTPEGQARLARALPGHLALVERWLTGQLPPDELAAFVATLRRLRDAVHPQAVAGTAGWTGCQPGESRESAAAGPLPPQEGRRSRR